MGSSSSKRVTETLQSSADFTTACTTVYQQSLSLTQQAFPGLPRYQIASASDRLYQTLTSLNLPLINKWVNSPPTRTQIDKSLQRTVPDGDGIVTVGESEFKEFAVDLYRDVIVSNAQKAVLVKVPIGVAGIAGIGMFTRSGMEVVGTVIGVYAVGVATSVYLSFGG
ncbi:hypothetical protein HanRHA438_Chr14g0641961 [Helianthus annuus]|uniref:Uncharacterized protein n=1 Tax=Helianthus annuus TaxID=4232 RepID=A0A251SES5_HELAN|nr:uncharacterized protein LOC110908448 [Helianthus annuus]KAF5767983.1 hypothetical protein HanXRQr2_Chr14g0631011 [Helianthus annuus]KAJ0467397.1 hypothetical protein HanIR_Chr14g0684791 [Helianthus annuus]KAJ0484798.1 hypothetical protein HanHA89_Chr14g0560841 [Helianthus annuus]KAJ0638625.1 hypothetical protein HanHA300_Chr00c0078g0705901 [Helianthus annuus]KAJ0655351.1 hypothetical protein HanLR1_Chr14g0523151 [Helianthus annuus]